MTYRKHVTIHLIPRHPARSILCLINLIDQEEQIENTKNKRNISNPLGSAGILITRIVW